MPDLISFYLLRNVFSVTILSPPSIISPFFLDSTHWHKNPLYYIHLISTATNVFSLCKFFRARLLKQVQTQALYFLPSQEVDLFSNLLHPNFCPQYFTETALAKVMQGLLNAKYISQFSVLPYLGNKQHSAIIHSCLFGTLWLWF